MTLAERLIALHRALRSADVPHAFGGAIALAYWTLEPRGTRDLDVNVFVPAEQGAAVLDRLPDGVARPDGTAARVARDGQVRLWWDDVPLDLFFDYAPIHADAARRHRVVPFDGVDIPVLGPVELATFKAMFDRTKDWADIEAIFVARTTTEAEVRRALEPMLTVDDHRWTRLTDAAERAVRTDPE